MILYALYRTGLFLARALPLKASYVMACVFADVFCLCSPRDRKAVIDNIKIKSNDFSVEPELTAKILKNKRLRVYEVPISYYGRNYAEGKKITWRHGFGAIWTLLKYRFVD